jgi:hypothetical protein
MIIDVHGHYTTAPLALEHWRNRQVAAVQDPAAMPEASELRISDDEIRETIETNQLEQMNERGIDLTVFSPRASSMAHHVGFVPAAMLPQSPGVDPRSCHVLLASEMIGAVRGIDPETGFHYDDTRRYVEAARLGAEEREMIYEGNARRVYPRLVAALAARGN